MKALPFIIQKFIFRDDPAVQANEFQDDNLVQLVDMEAYPEAQAAIPGYFVMSSAPPNIEEAKEAEPDDMRHAAQGIAEIAAHLYRIHQGGTTAPELVITVHGYNTSRRSVQGWYKDIFRYINRHDPAIARAANQVFIGYRWPSENIQLQRLWEAFAALPPLPRDVLIAGGIGGIVAIIFRFITFGGTPLGLLLGALVVLIILLGTMMMALVVLRLIVYFRDRYRANNFGVLDLVELLRQIDQTLVALKAKEIEQQQPEATETWEQAAKFWCRPDTPRVKLSFIGHSMGGFVVTNVVRILSDVFDARSIDKQPPADVGTVFRLERLLLASPDIPVLTIISSRANFLSSSLRRFAESYLFSSEGDVALRTASTAVNYIAFPSRTQSRGYRLGNVSINSRQYGIVNLNGLDQTFVLGTPLIEMIARSPDKVLETLFLSYQRFGSKRYVTLADLFQDQAKRDGDRITVADFFTFFDCTDYKDVEFDFDRPNPAELYGEDAEEKPSEKTPLPAAKGILTRAQGKPALNTLDYFWLTLDYALNKRNVHGGYFDGEFSQQLLYRIAFLGFTNYLKTLHTDPNVAFDPHVSLSKLHIACRDLGIQSFLSPIRYRVDIQGKPITDTKGEILEAIASEPVTPKAE
ncbi:MAG: alpha/beta hydrolase [Cyanobacteria bacterium P01_A01_bin.123]